MTSYPPAASARRPTLVTVLVVLVVISGIASILTGVLVIIIALTDPAVEVAVEGQGVDASEASSVGLWLGIIAVVIGLIYLLVARGLLRGSDTARLVVAIVSALNIASGVWAAISQTGAARSSAIGSIVFGVLILIILFSPKANDFFASR